MKKFEVEFVHVIERTVTCSVFADSEGEAIQKAKDGEWDDSDEDDCPENGIETKDYKIV